MLEEKNEQLFSIWEKIWNTLTPEFFFKLLIIYFFIVWISLIVWVIKDISVRTNSRVFQIISILIIVLWSPFSIFLYLLIRPRRTLYDKYYEWIEDNLEIINLLVEERRKKFEENFRRKEIPTKNNNIKIVQKEFRTKVDKWLEENKKE